MTSFISNRRKQRVAAKELSTFVVERLYLTPEPISFQELQRAVGENENLLRRSLRYLHRIGAVADSSETRNYRFYTQSALIQLTIKGRWTVYQETSL